MDPGDEPPFPAMSPAGVDELTDDMQDKQNGLKSQAADLMEDGKLDEALKKLTEAIEVGCASAMLLARRAQVLMQLDRPRAAANDCIAALAVNPDSAKAMKIRARAYLKLEMFEEAHADFQTALKIDFDDQTYEDSKDVEARIVEARAAAGKQRKHDEDVEYQRKLQESKIAYEAGLKANEEKFREERLKEEEEKRKKEEERKERCRQREQGDDTGPKEHTPPEPAPTEPQGGAEEVD